MLIPLALAALTVTGATTGPTICLEAPAAGVNDELKALYEQGSTYEDFLAHATRRKALWEGNTEKAEGVDMNAVERASSVGGSWHLLVVAVDGCSDSVSTIPYLAKLASLVDGLDLRIVDSDVGRSVMEARRTPDGRAATPTIVLLDADFEERGCFIERPKSLQDWIMENDGQLSRDAIFEHKMEWYADDAGAETVSQVVGMLEAASRGQTYCD